MATSCYLCHTGHQEISNVTPGDVLGICQNCSIAACDAHAHRNPHSPCWVCVICDKSVLGIAGALTADNSHFLLSRISEKTIEQARKFSTIQEFIRLRPEYKWIDDFLGQKYEFCQENFRTGKTEPLWYGFSENGRNLIVGALLIIEKYGIHYSDVITFLRPLVPNQQFTQLR